MSCGPMSYSMFRKPGVTWAQVLVWLSLPWPFIMFSMLPKTGYCGMSVIRFSFHFPCFLLLLPCVEGGETCLQLAKPEDSCSYFDCVIIHLQTYPHKILTGRRDKMHTMRQTDGLSGFTKRSESEYDCFGTGHSSTSISAGLGNNLSPSNWWNKLMLLEQDRVLDLNKSSDFLV